MFRDKVYEDLDDISKMIEPYQYSVNEDLSRFPDRLEVSCDMFTSMSYTSIRDILWRKCDELNLLNLKQNVWDLYQKEFFSFEMVDDSGDIVDSLTLNIQTKEINGKIFIIKNLVAFEDEDVAKLAADKIFSIVDRMNWRQTSATRINEVADLLGTAGVLKEKSSRRKIIMLANDAKELIKSKKIDIRDVSLVEKLGKWIELYCVDGNLPALANIAKIKIMSHQNRPIYSIQEQETV